MPCQFNMIFSGIFKNIWHWEHSRGESTWPWGSRARPPQQGTPLPRGPMVAPLHVFLHPHTPSSQKNHYPAQARVLAHFAAIFDLLAQSSIHKTALGDCSLVCDSSNGPISFCSSALFIANLYCLGDSVLELACQIDLVPSSSNAWYSL